MIEIKQCGQMHVRFYGENFCVVSHRSGGRRVFSGHVVDIIRVLSDYEYSDWPDLAGILEGRIDEGRMSFLRSLVSGIQEMPKGSTTLDELFSSDSGFSVALQRSRVPVIGMMEITHRCNLRCGHCYVLHKVVQPQPKQLDGTRAIELINELTALGCLDLSFTGGEPTLHKAWQTLLTEAKNAHLYTYLKTNATTFSRERARRYANDCAHETHVSIYGSDAVVHDQFTAIHGSFDKTVAGLQALADAGVRCKINCTVWRGNFEQVGAISALVLSLGHYVVFDDVLHGRLDGDRYPLSFAISPSQHETLVTKEFLKNVVPSPCVAGKLKLKIDAEAGVATCELVPKTFGNVNHTSIAEVWNGSLETYAGQIVEKSVSRDGLQIVRNCPGLNILNLGSEGGENGTDGRRHLTTI